MQGEIIRDPVERWQRGLPHHPESIRLYEFISKLDFEFGDFFEWKSGGDGDNGEQLLFHLDTYFETLAKAGTTLEQRISDLELFVRDIRDNWDHDVDSHRYNTLCRVCEAEKLLGG